MRDGFILHEKTMRQIARLEPDDTAFLINCLIEYYNTGHVDIDKAQTFSVAVAVVLEDAIERMAADTEAYEKTSKSRSEAGKAGADARWHKNSKEMANDSKRMASDSKAMPSDNKNAVSVSVSDSVSVNKRERRFTPPSPTEVRAYCDEGGYTNVDEYAFVDFYTAKGWKVGSQPMKDWKAAVRNWNRREEKSKKPPDRKTAFHNFPQRSDPDSKDLVQQLIAAQH